MDFAYGFNQNQGYGHMPANVNQAPIGNMMYSQQMQQRVPGKMIQSPNDIMPGDVPMNGTPCFFPMADGSAVFAKAWNADGTITTMRFVPEQPIAKEPTQLDRIEEMLTRWINSQSDPCEMKEAANEQHA